MLALFLETATKHPRVQTNSMVFGCLTDGLRFASSCDDVQRNPISNQLNFWCVGKRCTLANSTPLYHLIFPPPRLQYMKIKCSLRWVHWNQGIIIWKWDEQVEWCSILALTHFYLHVVLGINDVPHILILISSLHACTIIYFIRSSFPRAQCWLHLFSHYLEKIDVKVKKDFWLRLPLVFIRKNSY